MQTALKIFVFLYCFHITMLWSECSVHQKFIAWKKASERVGRLYDLVGFQIGTINKIGQFIEQCEQNPDFLTMQRTESLNKLWTLYMQSFNVLRVKLIDYGYQEIDECNSDLWKIIDYNNMQFRLDILDRIESCRTKRCSSRPLFSAITN